MTAKLLLFTNPSGQTLGAIEKTLNEQKKKNPKQTPLQASKQAASQAASNPGLIAGLVIGSPDFQRR